MGNTTLQPPCAHQRKFVLDDKPSVILATIAMARAQLPGHDEDDVISLIDEGFLLFAWNIALREDASREVRIHPDCLNWYVRTHGKGAFPFAEEDVASGLLKRNGDKPFIRGSVLRLILNCSSAHIINLVEAKLLKLVPDTEYHPGPLGTPLITVSSLKSFLKSRRLL